MALNDDPTGLDWSDREIDLIVADYFDMLRMERAGDLYVKAERNRALQELTHRSRGSIEFQAPEHQCCFAQTGNGLDFWL